MSACASHLVSHPRSSFVHVARGATVDVMRCGRKLDESDDPLSTFSVSKVRATRSGGNLGESSRKNVMKERKATAHTSDGRRVKANWSLSGKGLARVRFASDAHLTRNSFLFAQRPARHHSAIFSFTLHTKRVHVLAVVFLP